MRPTWRCMQDAGVGEVVASLPGGRGGRRLGETALEINHLIEMVLSQTAIIELANIEEL